MAAEAAGKGTGTPVAAQFVVTPTWSSDPSPRIPSLSERPCQSPTPALPVPDLISPHHRRLGPPMHDLLLIAVTVVFFAVAVAYVRGCDRL